MKYLVVFVVLLTLMFWRFWLSPDPEAVNHAAHATALSHPAQATTSPAAVPPPAPSAPTQMTQMVQQLPDEQLDPVQEFAETIQYPPYAQPYHQPVLPADDQVFSPVQLEQQDGSVWQLTMHAFRSYRPDPIQFQLTGPNNGELLTIELQTASGVHLATEQQVYNSSSEQQTMSFSPSSDWPEELSLFIRSQDGDSIRTGFEWVTPVASVVTIQPAQLGHDGLAIPVELAVHRAGLYHLQALLLVDDQVVALLQSEHVLTTGDVITDLSVYGGLLPEQRGELTLTSIRIQRRSEHPSVLPSFGRSDDTVYPLGQFSRGDTRYQRYQPTEQELQTLEYLRQLKQTSP